VGSWQRARRRRALDQAARARRPAHAIDWTFSMMKTGTSGGLARRMSHTGWIVLVACVLGVPVGVGGFTFVYAKGFSYLSSDPRACVNCHVMNDEYAAWLKSGHRHTATCVECHLPHAGVAKWLAKGEHGFRHSVAFTLQNFKEPIEITRRDRRIVADNCWRCHAELVHALPASVDCLRCHAGAGHGPRE
jgi:cytochrome c nitrite reductase small subunit